MPGRAAPPPVIHSAPALTSNALSHRSGPSTATWSNAKRGRLTGRLRAIRATPGAIGLSRRAGHVTVAGRTFPAAENSTTPVESPVESTVEYSWMPSNTSTYDSLHTLSAHHLLASIHMTISALSDNCVVFGGARSAAAADCLGVCNSQAPTRPEPRERRPRARSATDPAEHLTSQAGGTEGARAAYPPACPGAPASGPGRGRTPRGVLESRPTGTPHGIPHVIHEGGTWPSTNRPRG